jgi:hypothetical protein
MSWIALAACSAMIWLRAASAPKTTPVIVIATIRSGAREPRADIPVPRGRRERVRYRTLGTFARLCVARASRIAVMTNVWISMPFCKQ